jgi:hypothetical protein
VFKGHISLGLRPLCKKFRSFRQKSCLSIKRCLSMNRWKLTLPLDQLAPCTLHIIFVQSSLIVVRKELLQKPCGKNMRRNQIIYLYAIKTPLKPSGKIGENDIAYIDFCFIANSYEKTSKGENHKQVWRPII